MERQHARILVVDDDDVILTVIGRVLAQAGYEVVTASEGHEALEHLDGGRLPDLVLCDVNMPGLDGFGVLERLRDAPGGGTVPFIFLTARSGSDDLTRGLGLGADDYVDKTTGPAELLARVRAKLERPSMPAAVLNELAERQRAIDLDMQRAAVVQRGLFPSEELELRGYELAGECVPARSVGGDFYDWRRVPGGIVVTLADVMGKGIGAAILMATVRAVFRGAAADGAVAPSVAEAAALLSADLSPTTSFVTFFHARVDLERGRVTFVDGGHGLAFVARRHGAVEHLSPRGLPLGLTDDAVWEEGAVDLEHGDALVVCSDGVVEALGGDASPDALEGVLAAIAVALRGEGPPGPAVHRLLQSLDEPEDDMTVVVLRRTEGSESRIDRRRSVDTVDARPPGERSDHVPD